MEDEEKITYEIYAVMGPCWVCMEEFNSLNQAIEIREGYKNHPTLATKDYRIVRVKRITTREAIKECPAN